MKTKFAPIILLVILSSFLFEACSSSPRFTSNKNRSNIISVKNIEDLSKYEGYPVLETKTGVASFYADKYNGRITYSGEVYDMNGISGAHPSYQMNTIVRITNLENDKHVILRINDKMPERGDDRIIDVSLGTAKELDFVEKGLVKVKIEVLEWGNGRK